MKHILGKVGLTYEGVWNAKKSYPELSVVRYEGIMFISFVKSMGDEPKDGSDVWKVAAERGESLYQMMVRTGRYSGTEAEFLSDYENAIAEARAATDASIAQTAEADRRLQDIETAEAERMSAEAERRREEAERKGKESERSAAETQREQAELRRERSMQDLVTEAQTAASLAGNAATKAETASDSAQREAQNAANAAASATLLTPRVEKMESEKLNISDFGRELTKGGTLAGIQDSDTVVIIRNGKRYSSTAAQLRSYINYGITVEFLN